MAKLVFAHLTDMHVGRSPGYSPEKIGEAIASHLDGEAELFLVASGDVAFSGRPEEYCEAARVLDEVLGPVRKRVVDARIHRVAVPGNHDCDFAAAQGLDSQRAFFRWAAGTWGAPAGPARWWECSVAEGLQRKVLFHCVNTAAHSQLDDYARPGGLAYDCCDLPPVTADSELAIAVVHHPLDWLEYASRGALSGWIRAHVDLVFCGHTHAFNPQSAGSAFGANVRFVGGRALWDPASRSSGFQVLEVDGSTFEGLLTEYRAEGSMYRKRAALPLGNARNPALCASRWQVSARFAGVLADPELVLPKPGVALGDIFVDPTLVRQAPPGGRAGGGRHASEVTASELAGELEGQRVIISGGEGAGKTALARTYFARLRASGLVPLILSGADVPPVPHAKGASKALRQAVGRAAAAQYGDGAADRFAQLDAGRRALIIDDLRCDISPEKLLDQVELLAGSARTVVGLASACDPLSSALGALASGAGGLEWFDLKEFGYLQRDQLIERWLLAGDVSPGDGGVARRAAVVTTVICGLMPSTPRTILAVLQLLENAPNSATVGSYGHIYHSLITAALSRVGGSSGEGEIDVHSAFLAQLAYAVRLNGGRPVSQVQVEDVARGYEERFRVPVEAATALSQFGDIGILAAAAGGVSFRYPYAYYYFLASFCRDAGGAGGEDAERARALLGEMTGEPWLPENGVTLAFYVYLTKDRVLIDSLVGRAKGLLAEFPPCALTVEDDAGFFSQAQGPERPIVLAGASPEENRRQHLASLDKGGGGGRVPEGDIGKAMAVVEVLGRILKNFPGSLQWDVKEAIVEECYALSMRCAGAALGQMRAKAGEMMGLLEGFIREHRPDATAAEVSDSAEAALAALARLTCVAFVRAAAAAAGTRGLDLTYRDVRGKGALGDAGLVIDAAVRLENFLPISIAEIRALNSRLAGRRLARFALRDVVAIFLYLFRCDHGLRQQLQAELGIESSPRMLLNPAKKVRA